VFGTLIFHLWSVIIGNFNIVSIAIGEAETDPPVVIDGDGVLTSPVSPKLVKSVSRRNSKVLQSRGRIDVLQLSCGMG
jgi:hypothetical protein